MGWDRGRNLGSHRPFWKNQSLGTMRDRADASCCLWPTHALALFLIDVEPAGMGRGVRLAGRLASHGVASRRRLRATSPRGLHLRESKQRKKWERWHKRTAQQ
jgi:hypothetical protein